jgi:apolipoprotein N-acyltransferase
MKFFSKAKAKMPSRKNSLLAVFSAVLLALAFPDFEFWFLAWFALVPFFWAVEREKQSSAKSFFLGWLWGAVFFFGTCWWLAYAPTHYGGLPAPISYFLVLCATAAVGIFPGIFAALFSVLLKRFGTYGIFAAPFLWTAIEFLRFWTTGNNWNAIAYSQAFQQPLLALVPIGGVYLTGFSLTLANSIICYELIRKLNGQKPHLPVSLVLVFVLFLPIYLSIGKSVPVNNSQKAKVIAVQPNVPMSGLRYEEWQRLRQKHVELTEAALQKLNEQLTTDRRPPTTVIFPESPMNFRYERDREFQQFLREFTARNNVGVLFNSAEPDKSGERYFNSAVMVNERGEKTAQYDKIFLLPFGEYAPVPAPLQSLVPTMVGNFSFGTEYDLFDFGAAKAGVMICFESHFPNLSREYALQGADVIVEMTNDGYLGNTPVLRQHLANAVFRAVETNRPVLRVTNVGVTAYINERGEVLDAAEPYTEATRIWTVSKSDGAQTFYVRYGDWFAWLCSIVSLGLIIWSFWKRSARDENKA